MRFTHLRAYEKHTMTVKPRAYLAGGINGLSDDAVFGWRLAATNELETLYEIVDPSVRDFRGVEAGNEAAIVEPDLDEIASCQLVLVNAERPSWGTAMEVRYAFAERSLYVVSFGAGEKPSPWLVYHSDVIVPKLADAIGACHRYQHWAWVAANRG